MMRFDKTILISVIIYGLLAAASGLLLINRKNQEDGYYKVEINRILDTFEGSVPDTRYDEDTYQRIADITFISADEDEGSVHRFFINDGETDIAVVPWYYEDEVTGYLKFKYRGAKSILVILLISEASLLLMELASIAFFLILRRKLVLPFIRLNELQDDLSKGHFSIDVNEEQRAYLNDFTRSLGRLKDSLSASKKRELKLQKDKKVLLLSLSHDVKTPLNTIMLYTKALNDGLYKTEEDRQKAFANIIDKAVLIEKYVDDIMCASRDDILDIQIEKGEFYLKDLIDKVSLVYSEKCKIRMIKLTVGEYNNKIIYGDIERLYEVLENLIENAFKYGDGNRIEITFSEEEYHLLIRVYNSGTAVSDNDINHIFESFFRGSNSTRQQGNGLGLYICREIMEKQGYQIFAEKCDNGMAFVLVI